MIAMTVDQGGYQPRTQGLLGVYTTKDCRSNWATYRRCSRLCTRLIPRSNEIFEGTGLETPS